MFADDGILGYVPDYTDKEDLEVANSEEVVVEWRVIIALVLTVGVFFLWLIGHALVWLINLFAEPDYLFAWTTKIGIGLVVSFIMGLARSSNTQ